MECETGRQMGADTVGVKLLLLNQLELEVKLSIYQTFSLSPYGHNVRVVTAKETSGIKAASMNRFSKRCVLSLCWRS